MSNQNLFLERIVIARPGGNDTALIFDPISRAQQVSVSKLIQKNNPSVEQVMFVEKTQNGYYGQMAGGEFCGNATRSLAAILAKDGVISKNETVTLNVSGSVEPLSVRVTDSEALACMPVSPRAVTLTKKEDGVTLVELEGISFIVLEPAANVFKTMRNLKSVDDCKSCAFDLITFYGLDDKAASGVLVLSQEGDKFSMDPYVYVRDTQTLYFETACGSGTTAVGLILAQRWNRSLTDLAIYQPSGMPIKVSVDYTDGLFNNAAINGPVDIIFDGAISLDLVQQRSAVA